MDTWIPNRAKFPQLESGWETTSEKTNEYNCIAWAAGEMHRAWWPNPSEVIYWPDEGGEPTLSVFLRGFGLLGYIKCESDSLDAGYLKVAIYVRDGEVQHMARQLPSGMWTSKVGAGLEDPDIVHKSAACLAGPGYGTEIYFMKKAVAS